MKNKIALLVASEQDVASERNRGLPREIDLIVARGETRGELARLVELAISGQIRFRNDAEDSAARNHCGAIEKEIADFERQSDHAHDRHLARGFDDLLQRREASIEHDALLKKIVAGVSGEAEFRKQYQRYFVVGGAANQCESLLAIERRIGDPHGRNRDRDTNQVMIVEVEKFSSGLHAQ